MNRIKIICLCLFIGFLTLMAFSFLKFKHHEAYRQRIALAREIRKALDHLMPDLYAARENTIQGVQADGQWYNRITFEYAGQGMVSYALKEGHLWRLNNGRAELIADHIGDLRIRRQKETPDMLEVQLEARNNVVLVSNLRIRVRD